MPRGRYLHPKFVTVLLNDLFGIQSRAGCSCAGPYGHRLLGIDQPTSELYRDWVRKGFQGIKPGWCRVGFHYAMDDLEAGFIMDAVEFVAEQGHRFLPLYRVRPGTGMWSHREYRETHAAFSLDAALGASGCDETALPAETRSRIYADCLAEARSWAERLGEPGRDGAESGSRAVRGAEVLQRRLKGTVPSGDFPLEAIKKGECPLSIAPSAAARVAVYTTTITTSQRSQSSGSDLTMKAAMSTAGMPPSARPSAARAVVAASLR